MTAKVILIEFNELSPVLLQRFMNNGDLPNFQRFYRSSAVYTTDAEAQPPHLEPWIQWPSVHFGLPYGEHGLFHLGDQEQGGHATLAETLSEAGLLVGVCGSMNIPARGINGFHIPDPWNTSSPVTPSELEPFFHTVSTMVLDNSRPRGVGRDPHLAAFGTFMLRHGITLATVRHIIRQLLDERRDPGVKWRRASALDWLQYDVFRHLARKFEIDFGSFFSNSTAHYQHYHWRNMDPADFGTPPDESDHPSLRDAVLYGYRSMDKLLGRFMADSPGSMLVLCTALSQVAWIDSTKMTYRPRDFAEVMRFAGVSVPAMEIEPIMAEEFIVHFPSAQAAEHCLERFASLTVHGRPLMRFERKGRSLVGGCAVNEVAGKEWTIDGGVDGRALAVRDLFHPVNTVRSGRHSPVGTLWCRTGEHRVEVAPTPLVDIAPTILHQFAVGQPEHMRGRPLALPIATFQ